MSTPRALTLALATAFAGAAGAWVFLSGSDDGSAGAQAPVVVQISGAQDDGYIGARTRGSPEAPVTIYEVSDFQCPFCKMFVDSTLPALEAEYIETGKVQIIFVNFPLVQLHPNAPAAHEFAMCAAKQDRFWPVHDLLFRHQEVWEKLAEPGDYFRQLGDSAGLAMTELDTCFASGEVRDIVQGEVQAVFNSGINSTPSFMIEGGLLPGAQPIEVFRQILDSLVEARSSR
jgi:protein-disulfide isomerase